MDDMHEAYSQELRATPVLTALQERSLAEAIEVGRDAQERIDGGETGRDLRAAVEAAAAARDKFIRSNLRLVVSIARRYHLPPGIELQDLVQEGSLGLEHAVDKFQWRKGFKFSTYGSFWIRQTIGRSLDYKSNLVHIPVDRSVGMRRAMRACGDTAVDLDDENARLLQLSRPLYLDSRISPHSEQSVMDLIADDSADPGEQAVASIQRETLRSILRSLSDNERHVVERHFGLCCQQPHTMREIAQQIGMSTEGTRRILIRTMDKIKRAATRAAPRHSMPASAVTPAARPSLAMPSAAANAHRSSDPRHYPERTRSAA